MRLISLAKHLSVPLLGLLQSTVGPLYGGAIDLDAYPLAEEVLLGRIPASIEAQQTDILKAPSDGDIEFHVAPSRGIAQAGELLAFQGRKQLDLEGRLLDLERKLTEKQQIPEQQLALFNNLRRIENREAEITQQLEFMEEIESNPELSTLFDKGLENSDFSTESAAARLESERIATQQLLAHLEDPEVRSLAEELVEIELRKRELEHDRKVLDARIEMPFEGTYQFLIPTQANETPTFVTGGTSLFLVENLQTIYAIVEIHGASWRVLPQDQLRLRIVGLDTLESPTARFSHVIHEDGDRRNVSRYAFAFTGDGADRVGSLRGGSVSAELLLAFNGDYARIVPKLDLLETFPEAFQDSWRSGATRLFDELEAVYVGRDALALIFTAER